MQYKVPQNIDLEDPVTAASRETSYTLLSPGAQSERARRVQSMAELI